MNIRSLEPGDIHLISDLQPEGWQDILPAINFYLNSSCCFPIKATINKTIVGIGTTIIHHDIAWLAHIIVRPDNRNQGVGKLITQTLIESSKIRNCQTVYLIATDLGEPVYKKLGFEAETEYLFFKDINLNGNLTISENIVPYTDKFYTSVSHLDKLVSGEDRMFQLEKHLSDSFLYLKDNTLQGVYLPTLGEGLIHANTYLAGQELMKFRLLTKTNAAFPIDNLSAAEFMHQNNFIAFKTAKRMTLGAKKTWHPASIYNRIGGNLG